MSQYQKLASALQSRIAKRAAAITDENQWKQIYHAKQQMESYRNSKQILKELGEQQNLDKVLLKAMNSAVTANDYNRLLSNYLDLVYKMEELAEGV